MAIDTSSGELWTKEVDSEFTDVTSMFTTRLMTMKDIVLSNLIAGTGDDGNRNETLALDPKTGEATWTYPGVTVGFDDEHYLFVEDLGNAGTSGVALSMVVA